MRYVSIAVLTIVLAGCGGGEVVSTDTAETDTGVSTGSTAVATETSATITPGTSSPAATATGTIAPEPARRTTTSAPPGATGT